MFSHKSLLFFVGLCIGALAINGEEIDDVEIISSRPRYHVDILRLDDNDQLTHVCDGAIIDSRYVLTAAHCIYSETISNLLVRSGSDIAPPPNMPHQEERLFHHVIKAMYPKDFVNAPCRHHEHDIAIVKVNRAFDLAYDRLYKQVNLPESGNDYENYEALISGYSEDDKLNTLEAKVISNEDCSKNSTSIVTRGNLCSILSEEAVKATAKISGSPLVYDNTIIGVMNAPSKCDPESKVSIKCVSQSPQLKLYTRVSVYLEFIEKVLNRQASADIVYQS